MEIPSIPPGSNPAELARYLDIATMAENLAQMTETFRESIVQVVQNPQMAHEPYLLAHFAQSIKKLHVLTEGALPLEGTALKETLKDSAEILKHILVQPLIVEESPKPLSLLDAAESYLQNSSDRSLGYLANALTQYREPTEHLIRELDIVLKDIRSVYKSK